MSKGRKRGNYREKLYSCPMCEDSEELIQSSESALNVSRFGTLLGLGNGGLFTGTDGQQGLEKGLEILIGPSGRCDPSRGYDPPCCSRSSTSHCGRIAAIFFQSCLKPGHWTIACAMPARAESKPHGGRVARRQPLPATGFPERLRSAPAGQTD